MKIKKLTSLAMLTAAALIIFVIESGIPPLTPIPGIKMGLANVITLVVLAIYGGREAFAVLIIRILLGGLFAGTAISLIYSLAGGILSFIVMVILIKRMGEKLLWVISVFGAVAHNAGQLAAAVLLTSSFEILWYAPVLVISGIVTGAFTGAAASAVLKRIRKDEKEIIK